MVWTLLAYMFFWVALFCLGLFALLHFSGRTQSDWLKRLASRFGQTPTETEPVRAILGRFGIMFLAAGLLFLLISTPTNEMSPEDQGVLTLVEVACAVIIFWQIKGVRDSVKDQPGRSTGKVRR